MRTSEDLGRVCPFANQQCTRARGCSVFTSGTFDDTNIDHKLRALNCARRGAHIFRDEVTAARFLPDVHAPDARDRYARSVRSALHTRRRRLLQLPLPVEVAT